MKCPKCKQEIDDNSVFCDYCGEKIVQKTPERPVVEKKEPNENVPKKKRKWLKPTLIGGGIVLAIGIVIGVLAITDTSRWDEINSNQIASWPSCHGGDGTFYILQKGEDQSLVRVEGEFPISIVREIDFCGYHRDIFAQEGDNNGVGVFAILKLGSIEFSIFKYLDDGKISRYDITNYNGIVLESDKDHIYGIDKDRRCGDSTEWLGTIFASNRQPVRFDGKWHYIDINGDRAIDDEFDAAYPFYYGVARVSKDGVFYYIKPDGSYLTAYDSHTNSNYSIIDCSKISYINEEIKDFNYDYSYEKAVAHVLLGFYDSEYVFWATIDNEGNVVESDYVFWKL